MIHFKVESQVESQFLTLLYIWNETDPQGMDSFFPNTTNSKIVSQAMRRLMNAVMKYDSDRSMRLSKFEAGQLFEELLPAQSPIYEKAMDELFPQVR